ncbi:type II secretion system protein [Brevundimonas diminuta]|uniref:type II secretion system protein n=1 Tax=Brevundimonas diminuta TaxID=293 RepID=UPI003D03E43A
MKTARRSGFSLIEALVVLAIGGMALAVIFSIGIKAGDTGFSLGRRAMSVADADVAISDLRSIIRSVSVRPPASMMEGVDRPILAAPDRLEADVVMERATGCAPQGWAGRLTLSLSAGGEPALMCQAGDRTVTLMTLPGGAGAALSYSENGQEWGPTFETPNALATGTEGMRSRQFFVRLKAGSVDVIETASSGLPGRWARPDVDF